MANLIGKGSTIVNYHTGGQSYKAHYDSNLEL